MECAYSSGRSVLGLSLQPLDFWVRVFDFRWGYGCSSVVFVVCCLGSDLNDMLITRSEESCRMCLSNCMWSKYIHNEAACGILLTQKKKLYGRQILLRYSR